MEQPRVAVIGFGMAGIGAVHALRHVERFSNASLRPHITVFEAGTRPGGKVAPDNLGAQFLDADALYPFDRILDDLDIKTHPAREDYELVRLRLRNSAVIDAATFGDALRVLRHAMLEDLAQVPWASLDARSVHEVLHDLAHSERITADGMAAMRQRMLLEDGTTKLSALAYALSLAKTPTPTRRVEVRGGLYRIASRAREAALKDGVEIEFGARVASIEASGTSVRVTLRDGDVRDFDAAILALAPEHLGDIRVHGAAPRALAVLSRMTCARITKTNLVLRGPVKGDEHATESYAMWFTTRGRRSAEVMATFFHGWDGQTPLSQVQMLKAALGRSSVSRLLRTSSRTWDASVRDGDEVAMGYITEPRVGECVPLLRASREAYFSAQSSALQLATHALAIGGGVREAALSGEWAAVALLRDRFGVDVARALSRVDDPQQELYGASATLLARELDTPA